MPRTPSRPPDSSLTPRPSFPKHLPPPSPPGGLCEASVPPRQMVAFLPAHLKMGFKRLPRPVPLQCPRLCWLSREQQNRQAGPGDLIMQVEKQKPGDGGRRRGLKVSPWSAAAQGTKVLSFRRTARAPRHHPFGRRDSVDCPSQARAIPRAPTGPAARTQRQWVPAAEERPATR